MMYGLKRRRITVYKYLKGNIKEGERLFTAVERSLTGNKSLHLGAGQNWVKLKTQSRITVIKQRNVILLTISLCCQGPEWPEQVMFLKLRLYS